MQGLPPDVPLPGGPDPNMDGRGHELGCVAQAVGVLRSLSAETMIYRPLWPPALVLSSKKVRNIVTLFCPELGSSGFGLLCKEQEPHGASLWKRRGALKALDTGMVCPWQ